MHLPKSDMEECQRSLIASAYNMDRVMEKLQRLQALWLKKTGWTAHAVVDTQN